MEVETFWPEGADLRRLRRTIAVAQVAPVALLLLLGGFVVSVALLARGAWSLPRLWAMLAPATAAAVVLTALAAACTPRLDLWLLRRRLAWLVADAPALLAPGERLEAVCLGSFLGPRGYRLGFLVGTDRRLLRVERDGRRLRRAELATWAGLERLEPTQRRAGALPLLGQLLRLLGADRGLRVVARGGGWAFFCPHRSFLARFEPWLAGRAVAAGAAVDVRNDEDLEGAARPPEPAFDDVTLRGPGAAWAAYREAGPTLAVAALTLATLALPALVWALL